MDIDPPERPPDAENGVVQLEDLDFTRSERVTEIRDGQYVISTGGKPNVRPATDPEPNARSTREPDDRTDDTLDGTTERYGLSITATIEGRRTGQDIVSDDITTVFRELLSWYAEEVSAETPPDEVLGILLLSSGIRVRYPARVLRDLLRERGLTPEDAIGDLLATFEDEAFRLPPDS